MKPVTLERFAGINNVLPAERLRAQPTRDNATVELTDAVNVDIDDSGQLARRAGHTVCVDGAAHSLWAEGDDCLYAAGAELRRLLPDLSSEPLASLTPDLPLSYLALGTRVYWTNGAETGVIDGHNRSWGMPAPAVATLSAGTGQLAAGRYQVALTCSRRDGQESGAALPALVTLNADAAVTVTWDPPPDPDISGINVYLSAPDGMALYLAGRYPAAAGTATVNSARLALPLETQWLDPPPPGQCLGFHNGRILIGAGAFVYATVALGYEYVDLRDYLALDGSAIGFIAGVRGGVFIGTSKAVYFCAGERLEAYTVTKVVDAPCVARSAVSADALAATGEAGSPVVLFATAAGICLGRADGSVTNLTGTRYQFAASASGAALFRAGPALKQYLLFQS